MTAVAAVMAAVRGVKGIDFTILKNVNQLMRKNRRDIKMRCNRCHRPMKGTAAYDGACECGGLIERSPDECPYCSFEQDTDDCTCAGLGALQEVEENK